MQGSANEITAFCFNPGLFIRMCDMRPNKDYLFANLLTAAR